MEYYENVFDKYDRLEVDITADDINGYQNNTNFNKIYNKLWLAEKQNVSCGPIGTYPQKYPIIIKPIINLYGMSRGFKIIKNEKEYDKNQKDGFFWMPYLKGKNYTIDLVLNNGKIKGIYGMESKPSVSGTFEYHVYRPEYDLSDKNKKFIEKILKKYTGPVNIEIINDIIIEAHLRFNGDMYIFQDKFFTELNKMQSGKKKYDLSVKKEKFYLFPYFVKSNFNKKLLNKKKIEKILVENNISNIRWDDIDEEFQGHKFKRLFMIKTNKLKTGKDILNLIDNLLKKE